MGEKYERYVVADSNRYAARLVGISGGWLTAENASSESDRVALDRWNIYRVTVEEIEPPQEQPQWWIWNHTWREWHDDVEEDSAVMLMMSQDGLYVVWCCVYGTTADRNQKRDALLAAAKAAGKDTTNDL